VAFADPFFGVKVPRRFSTIITSSAGAPLDMTYYQTVKGIVGIKDALAPGGRVFIASDCGEGLGSADFRRSQEALIEMGIEAFLHSIGSKPMAAVDEWQTQKLTEILSLGEVVLYAPILTVGDRKLTGAGYTDDLGKAVAEWVNQIGDRSVLVVPEGPYVIPLVGTGG
jgi:hypothetical protein